MAWQNSILKLQMCIRDRGKTQQNGSRTCESGAGTMAVAQYPYPGCAGVGFCPCKGILAKKKIYRNIMQLLDVGSRISDVRFWKSEVGRPKSEDRSRKTED